ncbi:EVE domain-containing protein [Kallotenue papyrolyticum]|uniref:EVE domain-containing protein n=1 Tax=Kallotenue papyrolyticum TaxID=1325125 RepID=UPI000492B3EF|nr:EVE domain-containing protein [Kallotenue papyrolyticum]
MAYWVLKTEPDCYSFADLEREQVTVWDGVSNPQALGNLRRMQPGDQALIYHTGDERAAVGLAEIVSTPYPDPQQADPRRVVVDVRAVRRLRRPIPLSAIKTDPALAELALVRQGRLSVVPVPEELWPRLMAMEQA